MSSEESTHEKRTRYLYETQWFKDGESRFLLMRYYTLLAVPWDSLDQIAKRVHQIPHYDREVKLNIGTLEQPLKLGIVNLVSKKNGSTHPIHQVLDRTIPNSAYLIATMALPYPDHDAAVAEHMDRIMALVRCHLGPNIVHSLALEAVLKLDDGDIRLFPFRHDPSDGKGCFGGGCFRVGIPVGS